MYLFCIFVFIRAAELFKCANDFHLICGCVAAQALHFQPHIEIFQECLYAPLGAKGHIFTRFSSDLVWQSEPVQENTLHAHMSVPSMTA